MSVKKLLFVVLYGLSLNVFAANVMPQCTSLTSANASLLSIYASNQFILYTTGFSHEFFSLSKGQCINGDYPGIYKTTLVLKQDGNLVNYVYDIQNDITYIAFASDSAGLDVSSASFYFDSNVGFNSVMLELLSSDYSVIKHIVPTPTKASNKTLGGSLALGGDDIRSKFYGSRLNCV